MHGAHAQQRGFMPNSTPFRVLSLDGGGMRGVYSATYLDHVASAFARRRGAPSLDIGAAFDLIVGTSTGAIIGCALAHGVPLTTVIDLYRTRGRAIFPRPFPTRVGFSLFLDLLARPRALKRGADALRLALTETFGDTTVRQLYDRRGIALAMTAVQFEQHRNWVFKTPHHPGMGRRDDNCSLVDVCLAASAAPLYRSLAAIERDPGKAPGYEVFADGGLWANNPVLVGLTEALEMTEPGRKIEIFCLGTRPRPAGELIAIDALNRGFAGWKFGADMMTVSIDAQEFAYDDIARKLSSHVDRDCRIMRFPCGQVTRELRPYLALDDTRPRAIKALIAQARADGDLANGKCENPDDYEGRIISELFREMPVAI
jgi:hypothetical protein